MANILRKIFIGGKNKNSIIANYKAAAQVLSKKPILLWGLSLMSGLLSALATYFGVLPIISIPIVITLEASLAALMLKGLRGQSVSSADLFAGFNNFKRVAGGMAWMYLWIFIWGLIPIVGIVFAIIKAYSYRFTPYILMTRPDVGATEAIKLSMKMTNGLKGKMFWADVFVYLAFFVCVLVIGLFASIPYIGVLFAFILILLEVLFAAFSPIFIGLVQAKFYDDAASGAGAQPQVEVM